MQVPLTLVDVLERGVLHGNRVAVEDEPQGRASLGAITHRDLARRSRGMATVRTYAVSNAALRAFPEGPVRWSTCGTVGRTGSPGEQQLGQDA